MSIDQIALHTLNFLRQALTLTPSEKEIKSWAETYPEMYRTALKAEAIQHWRWLSTYIAYVDRELPNQSADWLTISLHDALTSTLALHVHVLSCRGFFLAPYLEQKLRAQPMKRSPPVR